MTIHMGTAGSWLTDELRRIANTDPDRDGFDFDDLVYILTVRDGIVRADNDQGCHIDIDRVPLAFIIPSELREFVELMVEDYKLPEDLGEAMALAIRLTHKCIQMSDSRANSLLMEWFSLIESDECIGDEPMIRCVFDKCREALNQ